MTTSLQAQSCTKIQKNLHSFEFYTAPEKLQLLGSFFHYINSVVALMLTYAYVIIAYEGSNIDVGVDNDGLNLYIKSSGDYIIELDGVVSFDTAGTGGSTTWNVLSSFVSSSVTVNNADGYGHFYAVSNQIGGGQFTTVQINMSRDWAGNISKYNCELTFKIHKK